MTLPTEATDFEFLGTADHCLTVTCRQCGFQADLEYLGLRQLKTTCRYCNASAAWKLYCRKTGTASAAGAK